MLATLFASGARNIRNSAPSINDKRKHLRRCTDPKPRRVIPVEEEIVVKTHACVRVAFGLGSMELASGIEC